MRHIMIIHPRTVPAMVCNSTSQQRFSTTGMIPKKQLGKVCSVNIWIYLGAWGNDLLIIWARPGSGERSEKRKAEAS